MIINWIEYENLESGLKVNRICFDRLTLLVGVSGTGKTTILNVIRLFQSVTDRKYAKDMEDAQLGAGFEIDGQGYEWYLRFGKMIDEENGKIAVVGEKLLIDGKTHMEKTDDGVIHYQSAQIPGLSQSMSCMNIFENDSYVRKIVEYFHSVLTYSTHSAFLAPLDSLPKSEFIDSLALNKRYMYIHPYFSLCYVHEKHKDVFEGIRDSYRDIFELVEDLYFEFDKSSNSYLLYQLEKGVAQPIRYDKLSSGMYKTLMLLTSLYTFRDGGILVIDEFENSFGANCIDEVVEVIKEFEDKFQFIITSHHPYIINNIPTGSWRVVGRKGREVMSRSARDFGIGATRHEAFLELVNLWKFDESVIV